MIMMPGLMIAVQPFAKVHGCTILVLNNVNLNGKYYSSRHVGDQGGVTWYYWKTNFYSMKTASMKITT